MRGPLCQPEKHHSTAIHSYPPPPNDLRYVQQENHNTGLNKHFKGRRDRQEEVAQQDERRTSGQHEHGRSAVRAGAV